MNTPTGFYRSHTAHLNPARPAAGCTSKRLHQHELLEQRSSKKEPNPMMLESTQYFIWCMHKHRDPALMKGGKRALAQMLKENCDVVVDDSMFNESQKSPPSRASFVASQRGSSQGSLRRSRTSQSGYPYPVAAEDWPAQRRRSAGSMASVSSASTATRERRAQTARGERRGRELGTRERGSRGGGYSERRGSSARPASARVDRNCQTSFSERSC